MLISILLIGASLNFKPRAGSKRKMLPSWYTLLSRDYNASDNSKSDLGQDKPHPIDLAG